MKTQINKHNYLFDNKALAKLILPLFIEQLLAILVGMADSIMIASVGEAAVSGVSLVDQIMMLMIQAFSALATGGAIVTGQYLGQKNTGSASDSAKQMVWFVTLSSIVITGLIYLGNSFILHGVFGKIEADVMSHARTYLLIVTASIPFIALYNCGAAIFRTIGNSKVSMKVSLIMNGINVVGNAVLIYGIHLGTAGAAIPTLVSRIIAGVLIIVLLFRNGKPLHFNISTKFRPDWSMIKKILSIGVPNGLENSMFQLGKILVLSLVSTFGTYAIAANAVSNVVTLFSILPGLTLCMAITTVVSRCVGAGDYIQARYYTKKLILLTHIGFIICIGIIFLSLPLIMKAYHLSPITAHMTKQIIYLHGICTIFIWPISFSLPTTFRAAGDAKVCMIISIISMWIFRIAFSYILGHMFKLGVFGIWIAMIIDWAFRGICFVIRYFSKKWEKAAIA